MQFVYFKYFMKPVVIIGAGMAGLQAATQLHLNQIPFVLIDAQSRVGGRVQSETVQGFTLDLGFQVLQTNYPEVQRSLDFSDLKLASFESGAYLWSGAAWIPFINPLRTPFSIFNVLSAGLMTFKDVYLLTRIWFVTQNELNPLDGDESTQAFLNRWGFSQKFQYCFLRPFFGGIFLSADLTPPASLFRYYMKQFLAGSAAIPQCGMGQISLQLAAELPAESIRLASQVTRISSKTVHFADNTMIEASHVILATDGSAAADLLGLARPKNAFWATKTFYFSADASVDKKTMLHLLPASSSRVLHFAYLNHIQASYAPEGKDLISVTTLDLEMQAADVIAELEPFVGSHIRLWKLIKDYTLVEALPVVGAFDASKEKAENMGFILAGDFTGFPSLQSALHSGRLAAESICID
jgi:predicted NAD/FAD-binding protein